MICYQGRTFCRDKECSLYNSCPTAYTAEHEAAALKWWGKEGAPVAFYSGRRECFTTTDSEATT